MSEKEVNPPVYLVGLALGLVGATAFFFLFGWQAAVCVALMLWGNNITERYTL